MSTRNTSTFQTLSGTSCDPGIEPASTPTSSTHQELGSDTTAPLRPGQVGAGRRPHLFWAVPPDWCTLPPGAFTSQQERLPARPPLASGSTKGPAALSHAQCRPGEARPPTLGAIPGSQGLCAHDLGAEGPGARAHIPAPCPWPHLPLSRTEAPGLCRAHPRTLLQTNPPCPSPLALGPWESLPPVFLSLALYTTP